MYRTQNLKSAFECIIDETSKCLNCDISRLFVIDNEKGDLWTKVNSGKLEIRIPMEEGIEGYVASKEESVNVMDAYQDDRFSKQVDIQTNYKTNTLLCVPIMDQNKKAVGVL